MTKAVRIENADTSDYQVVVQIWEKGFPDGQPDVMLREVMLSHPTAMDTLCIHDKRWLIIKELSPKPVTRGMPNILKSVPYTEGGGDILLAGPTMKYSDPVSVNTDESQRYLAESL